MRSQRGMQLIEMLTALFITAFIGMVMCEIAVTQNVVALKTNNKIDALVSARRFVPQFVKDVHMANSVQVSGQSCTLMIPDFTTAEVSGFPTGNPIEAFKVTYQLELDGSTYRLTRTDTKTNSTVVVAKGIVGPISNGQIQTFKLTSENLVVVTLEVIGEVSARSDINSKSFAFTTVAKQRSNQ